MPNLRSRYFFIYLSLRVSLVIFSLMLSLSAIAQDDDVVTPTRRGSRIIDDTTKQIYGPNTSKFFYERDVFFNRDIKYPIDTLIKNFHRYNYVQRYNYKYQDLGNVGLAIRPLFYKTPDVIGRRSGMEVYDLYWDEEAVKYFDTKSSYSNMKVIIGGAGRSITKATYSRNITPQWNFGFDYRGQLIDKNLQRRGKADRQTRDYYYDGFTTFQSKDSTYRLFANMRRGFHRVTEYGGVRTDLDPDFEIKDLFAVNAQPWLTNAESNDLRIHAHIFHEYRVGSALQAYHVFDRYRQKTKFKDIRDEATAPLFDDFIVVPGDTIADAQKFKSVRNEVGLKGNLGKLFYNGYYAIRHYSNTLPHFGTYNSDSLIYDSLKIPHIGNEHYLGGRMSLFLDSIGEVNGSVELSQEGFYKLQGEIKSRWFEARLTQMEYSPGFVEQIYRGAYDIWNNKFSNIQSTQLNGYVHYRSKVFNLSPGLTFTRLHNYTFFKKVTNVDTLQTVLPVQSGGQQVIASPEVNLSITLLKRITLSGQAIYTRLLENADSAITIPELFLNAQLSYANIFFNGNFDIHTGVDVHWQSDYKAMAYDVAIRQFYIQNNYMNPAFPIVDVFLNAKIKRGRVFFKYHNIIQAFTKEGYQSVPLYPGQPNTFEFGFDWSFYD